MNDVQETVRSMLNNLDRVTVPQRELSPEEGAQFTAELSPIFLNTVLSTNKVNLAKLKRFGPLSFHPDKLSSNQSTHPFIQELRSAPKSVQSIPFQLFDGYITTFEELELNHDNWKIALLEILPNFWTRNVFTPAESASAEEKEQIATHNRQVVQYLLRGFNSFFIDTTLDMIYKYYRYPSFMVWVLYYTHAVLNSLLLAIVTLPIIALIIEQMLIFLIRTYVEEPFLFALTANYYYEYIEQAARAQVAETLKSNARAVSLDSDDDSSEYTESDCFEDNNADFCKKIDDYLAEYIQHKINPHPLYQGAVSPDVELQIKRQAYSYLAGNSGAQHLQYVIESIYFSLQQSFADDISLKTLLFALLRLCIAIPIVLGLSLPLVLADLSRYPLWAMEVGLIPAVILTKYLFAFVTSVPLYVYDAGLWLTRQNSSSEVVLEKASSDAVWAASFFASAETIVKKFVPEDIREYFQHSAPLCQRQ